LHNSRKPRGEGGAARALRLEIANRSQVELRAVDPEALLPPDHRARLVWHFVEGLDLSERRIVGG
jgi:uncharacterized membrane protein